MNDNWADPARTSLDPVDEFTADGALSDFAWAAGWLAVALVAVVAWLIWEVAPVLRFALS
jgi:hypothetical protein